jgi:hypothetical protein
MSLTPEQQKKAAEYVRVWTEIGLCTKPADRPGAEAAIHQVYTCGGLKPPKQIIWAESPAAMLRMAGAEALTQEQAAAVLAANAQGSKPAPLADCIYGQHDAGWLAFYAFMRHELGLVEQTEKLQGLTALAKCAGWAAPYEHICYVSERHTTLKRDPQGRLHAVDGPALAYPDQWSIYAVRGTHVPAEWITAKDKLDPRLALTEPNLERRAAVATILGWHKVMGMLKPRVIDDRTKSVQEILAMVKDGYHDDGRLVSVDLPDEGEARFLEVVCPAHEGEVRYVRVPREMTTARQASRWTYRLDDDVQVEGRS